MRALGYLSTFAADNPTSAIQTAQDSSQQLGSKFDLASMQFDEAVKNIQSIIDEFSKIREEARQAVADAQRVINDEIARLQSVVGNSQLQTPQK